VNPHLNRTPLSVAPIIDASTFWHFVNANKNAVTNVTFDLVPPNMFDGPENMDKELKELRDLERARKIRLELENPDSLNLKRRGFTVSLTMPRRAVVTLRLEPKAKNATAQSVKLRRCKLRNRKKWTEDAVNELLANAKRIIFEL